MRSVYVVQNFILYLSPNDEEGFRSVSGWARRSEITVVDHVDLLLKSPLDLPFGTRERRSFQREIFFLT